MEPGEHLEVTLCPSERVYYRVFELSCNKYMNPPGDVHMCDAPGNRKALLFTQ